MEGFILEDLKVMLNVNAEDESFDTDIKAHANASFMTLHQMGVGPASGFIIKNDSKWIDFIGEREDLSVIPTLLYLKVKLLFDPPTSSYVIEAMKESVKEAEWRLMYQQEKGG